jgi:type VI protein secretion system component Hcp
MPIYMQYLGITGNGQNVFNDKGWIEIFSWSFGASMAESGGSASSDREGSTPSVGEIVVTKPTDVWSHGLRLQRRELEVFIVFANHGGTGPRHTLKLNRAVITDIKPSCPQRSGRGDLARYEKLTFTFSEYYFNGLRNVPIPHTLVRFPGI